MFLTILEYNGALPRTNAKNGMGEKSDQQHKPYQEAKDQMVCLPVYDSTGSLIMKRIMYSLISQSRN